MYAKSQVDSKALYDMVNGKRSRAKLSWRKLAAKLEMSPSTFTRMNQGGCPSVNSFIALIKWLDMPADAFIKGITAETPFDRSRNWYL